MCRVDALCGSSDPAAIATAYGSMIAGVLQGGDFELDDVTESLPTLAACGRDGKGAEPVSQNLLDNCDKEGKSEDPCHASGQVLS